MTKLFTKSKNGYTFGGVNPFETYQSNWIISLGTRVKITNVQKTTT